MHFNNIHLADGMRVEGEVRMVDIALVEANELECSRLHLVRGDHVYRIIRIRLHLTRAFMIEQAALPASLFPDLEEIALPSHRLLEIAQAYRVLLGSAEERISLQVASPMAIAALNIAPGTQVLSLDRVSWTRGGRPAEWRRAECAANNMYCLGAMK